MIPSSPSTDLQDLAARWMASAFISDLIAFKKPECMARHLCEQIRELTGARTVAFFLHHGEHRKTCRPLHVCPERRMNLFENDRLANLCPACFPGEFPLNVAELPASNPLRSPLQESGIQTLLRTPIHYGDSLVGTFVIFDLLEAEHEVEIISMLQFMGPSIGIAIQNCLDRIEIEQQKQELEQLVQARAVELEKSNRDLTESRMAALNMMEDAILSQKQMAFQNNLFASFMDSLPARVFFKDTDGRLETVNKAYETQLGKRASEIVGKTASDFFPQNDAEKIRKADLHVMKSGEVLEEEQQINGRWENAVRAPRYDEDGKMVGSYGVAWDISARKEAESQLELSRFAMEHSGLAIFLTGQDGGFCYVNEAACQQLGYAPEELMELSIWHIEIDDVHSRQEWQARWEAVRREKYIRAEGVHRAKDGRTFPVEVTANFLTWDGQDYMIGFSQDITARKKAEQEIADLARFPEENTNPVARIDRDLHLLYANPAAEHFLSLDRKATGQPVSDPWKTLVQQAFENGESTETELSINESDYTVTLALVAESDYINLYARDITALKQTQEALRKNEEHLRTTLDSIGDAVISTDTAGLVIDMNRVAEGLTGWSRTEAHGQSLADVFRIINEETREPMDNPVDHVLQSGSITGLENQALLLARDGREIPVAESAAPIRTEEHQISGVVMVFRDQTTERANRRALEANEARFRNLLETIELIPVQGYNREREVIYWNAASTRVYGYTQEEAQGRKLEELIIPPFMRDEVVRQTEAWYAGGDPIPSAECRLLNKAGEPIPVYSSHVMHVDASGNKEMFCIDVDLRDLKRAENQMRESRNLLRAIIDTIPSRVWWKDLDCKFLGTNIQYSRDFGVEDPGTLIGRSTKDLFGKKWMENHDAADLEVMETGLPKLGVQEPIILPDGSRRWQETNKVPLLNEEGRVIGTVGTATDITDRKEAQEALRASEAQYRKLSEEQSLILNNNILGIALIRERVFEWVNPRLAEMLGVSVEEIQGHSTRVLYETDAAFEENGADAYENLRLHSYFDRTVRFSRADGMVFWCRLAGKALDPGNPDKGSIWMFEDISDRRQNEEELRRLSTAIEQSPEAIAITDEEGTIQYVNPAFETITGYERAEALGENPRILKSGEQDDAFYKELWETISSGRVWEGRIVNKCKDGTLFTEEASIAPVKDAQGSIINYVAVKRDISAELIHEAELRQAQKMEAVGQLAGGVAHDFNNILQGILGFSELLRFDLDKTSQAYDQADEIHNAALRAADLTRQLLTFSRKEPVRLEDVDLNKVIRDSEALLAVLLSEKHQLILDLQDNLPPIHADHSQLTQIIMNLSVNARDAMLDGGRLSISTESVIMDKTDAAYAPGARPGHYLCLSVTDTGSGMDNETKNRIFEPFFTTKEVGSGTGLGLSVIYGIVKQNQGWMNVYSEINNGTSFNIFFPVSAAYEGTIEPETETGEQAANARILLVEDDSQIRHMVMEILENEGYQVVQAPSAENALTLYNQAAGRFDLLLSDMELPNMRGDMLADALRSLNPTLPILLFSGYRDHAARWRHLADKGYLFMSKPFTTVILLDTVIKLIKENIITEEY